MTDPDPIRPRLQRALARLEEPLPVVPRSVDDAIARAARARLGRRPWFPFGPRLLRWLPPAAAAALLVWLAFGHRAIPGDLDGNGRIDILDAFALARRIEAGEGMDRALDVTGEGIVDRRDVDALAARAVRLEGAR